MQGNRQALDEKLATSDIQLFGRPAGAPGSTHMNGHAAHAPGVQLAEDLDTGSDDSADEDAEDDDAGSKAVSTPGRRVQHHAIILHGEQACNVLADVSDTLVPCCSWPNHGRVPFRCRQSVLCNVKACFMISVDVSRG